MRLSRALKANFCDDSFFCQAAQEILLPSRGTDGSEEWARAPALLAWHLLSA